MLETLKDLFGLDNYPPRHLTSAVFPAKADVAEFCLSAFEAPSPYKIWVEAHRGRNDTYSITLCRSDRTPQLIGRNKSFHQTTAAMEKFETKVAAHLGINENQLEGLRLKSKAHYLSARPHNLGN